MTRDSITMPRLQAILSARPIRFLLVGGLNTLVGYGLFVLCLAARMSPGLSLVVATGLGTLFNFASTGRIAFGSTDVRRLPVFVVVYAFLCAVNFVALKVFMSVGLSAALAQAVLVLPFAALAYVAQRDIVFRRPTTIEARP